MKYHNSTHDMSHTPLYSVWTGMKKRCFNVNCHAYSYYGGRGVTVCKEWVNDFYRFYEDMKDGYKKGMQLDRINNNGNYEKDNCRWVTSKQNCRNTRGNNIITYNGESMTVVEFCEKNNLPRHTYNNRLRLGWTIDEMTIPLNPQTRKKYGKRNNIYIEYKGERMTVQEFSAKYNVPYKTAWNWAKKNYKITPTYSI